MVKKGLASHRETMMRCALILLSTLPLLPGAATEGWTDVGSNRRIAEPGRILWRASGVEDAFLIERFDGAEGTVAFHDGMVEIDKTNDKGAITVTPRGRLSFNQTKHRRFRSSIRVTCTNAQIFATEAYLSFCGRRESFGLTPLDRKQWGCGRPRNKMLLNTAPGVGEIKYAHVEADPSSVPSPVLVVAGGRASVRCVDWVVEDFVSAQDNWHAARKAKQLAPGGAPRIAEGDFLAKLKSEREHTGRVVRRGARVVVEVDDAEVPPVFYKTMSRDVLNKGWNTSGGRRMMEEAGIGIHAVSMRFGRNGRYPNACWSKEGFDVKAGVREVCDLMRLTPEAKFVLSLELDPYAEYADLHPEEAWIGRRGARVFGRAGCVDGPREFGGQMPSNKFHWVSISARGWRDELKRHLSEFIAELKRTGLSRRVVGVHLVGFHDGQFAMSSWPDLSPSARDAFREFVGDSSVEIPLFDSRELLDPEKDRMQILWNDFIHRQPNRVLNDFARHIKGCFGKDIFVMRWCMAAFSQDYCGTFDVGEFTECDALDILVAQPSYGWRGPGLPLGCKIPLASFREHGKLFMNEFDFRTWNAFDSCMGSETSAMGLGCATDMPMWNTTLRRAAGQMFAQGMGFWFYDMAGGWYDTPEIATSIRDVLKTGMGIVGLAAHWRPNVALVVDERAFAMRNTLKPGPNPFVWRDASSDGINACYQKLCAAGVPYDVWLAEDLLRKPQLCEGLKMMVWTGMPRSDARRDEFFAAMKTRGVTIVRSEDMPSHEPHAFLRLVREAGGYAPVDRPGLQVDMNGSFICVHCLTPGQYDFRLPYPANVMNLKTGKPEPTAAGVLPLELVAGETCWFRLSP